MTENNDRERRFRGGSHLTRRFFKYFGIMSVREERESEKDN